MLSAIIIGTSAGFAQDQKKESYKSLKSRSSRSNVPQLIEEAEQLKSTNPSEALTKLEEALGMSLTQGNKLNQGKCYLIIGEINEGIQEWKLALDNYDLAYQVLSSEYFTTKEFNKAIRGIGNAYLKLGNYEQALLYFQESLKFQLNATERAERQLDISEVYFQLTNYSEALKTVEVIQLGNNSSLEVKLKNQKAKIYAKLNEVDKANDIYISSQNTLRASPSSTRKKEDQNLQNTKEEISEALRGQKKYDEDITLRNQSIDYNLESDNLGEVSKDKIELSNSLVAKGETNKAIRELEEAALIADTTHNPKDQARAFLTLADLYEKNGRASQALITYKKYSEAVAKIDEQNSAQQEVRSELIKKQKDIEELSKIVAQGQQEETLEQATLFRQQIIIYALLALLVVITVAAYFIYKNAIASKRANQLLALKSLRGQMNPHFIFNALNSINQFISQNDERTANKYLSEFSRLMRLVLENSQEDFISLTKEEELISLYLKLEHYRFRDKFDYQIQVEDGINKEMIELPPMLIQPYIENAVWHGLRYRDTKGSLVLSFKMESEGMVVEIKDDGIGRKRSAELKTDNQKKHQSTGLKNIDQRLSIINKVYHTQYRVSIVDGEEGDGTIVKIILPLLKNQKAA